MQNIMDYLCVIGVRERLGIDRVKKKTRSIKKLKFFFFRRLDQNDFH